jgi:hypothetical protein
VAIDHFAVAACEQGYFETALSERFVLATDRGVVLARVARIFDEPINRPDLDVLVFRRYVLRKHASPRLG